MERARRAVTSAQLLLTDGDINGACNRAYYAMFDAARAALVAAQTPIDPNTIKTHAGLISAFSLHLVKPGRLSPESGKALNRVAELRMVADYTESEVTADAAQRAIDHATSFIETVAREFVHEA